MIRFARVLTAMAATFLVCSHTHAAENYPNRRIDLLVPYTTGSGIDVLARLFAQALQQDLNVPIVVENRDGATGVIGTMAAARASNDGYAIMMNANPPFLSAPIVQNNTSYDPVSSFTPIARIGVVPMVVVTGSESPARTFQQLREYSEANPAKAFYATNGNGSPAQLFMEQIKASTGLKLKEVSYKSSTQPMTDVAAGHVLTTLMSLPAASGLIQAGKLRVLAVGTRQRIAKLPDVPSVGEVAGRPDLQAVVWYGFFAPRGTPADRVARIHTAIAKASRDPKVLETMTTAGLIPELLGPDEFARSLRDDAESTRKALATVSK